MEITNEQVYKILELADKNKIVDIEKITITDISKALVEIERKLNFYDVNINFNVDSQNILIVDDLELSLYHLNQLMKKVGFTTFVARNQEEAIAEIARHKFSYILIDLFLPNCDDGIKLIKDAIDVKKSGKQNYKVIVISGTDDKELIDKCYKLGIDSFITKTENWHNDILKQITPTKEKADNALFSKEIIENDIALYHIKKFNDKKIYDSILLDINATIISGIQNIALDLEKVMVFDSDNTYIFAEIYKECQNANGSFMLFKPSSRIKEALTFAYLEGVIPTFQSIQNILDHIKNT